MVYNGARTVDGFERLNRRFAIYCKRVQWWAVYFTRNYYGISDLGLTLPNLEF